MLKNIWTLTKVLEYFDKSTREFVGEICCLDLVKILEKTLEQKNKKFQPKVQKTTRENVGESFELDL